ncbi:FAD:protein FMN transferase [Aureivirga sp. CE67]|uniref:FAD:protein FMN transferase n=1 Tax=Aureivirga sp. CE67 TaxID=1788983 RepID=UPI001E2F92EC|nr:FAD:protein FMN transferase [Aureivirga sp. CE67]
MLKNFTLIFVFLFSFQKIYSQNIYKRATTQMGVSFVFSVEAENEEQGEKYLDFAQEEVKRIEDVISSWRSDTETGKVNQMAGIKAVPVSKELFGLIKRSIRVSKLTNGYFDISFASLDKVWFFDRKMTEIPDSITVQKSVSKIDFHNIILDEEKQTVFLKEKGMKIGFGAIGKGYAAESVKRKLQKLGVKSGLINASGDLTCWGKHPVHKKWQIAIANPKDDENALGWFPLENSSVVTSGNYEKFIVLDGKKYSHIIDPKTGWPVESLQSVTIFCPNAELADALATSVFVMGKNKGIELINKLKGIECLILDNQGEIFTSKDLKLQEKN